jgi:hypothetical protein
VILLERLILAKLIPGWMPLKLMKGKPNRLENKEALIYRTGVIINCFLP